MRTVVFHASAFADYSGWAQTDPKMHERITRLITETMREPFGGIGKPDAQTRTEGLLVTPHQQRAPPCIQGH